MLAGRYRIIGLLGRGGMGEVYRADDIKIGTPVALKFLPRALAHDPVRRERLLAEVRIARQIAHPNVCQVFDIAETPGEGQQFLSMEYIDGEDLASLLLRIGRLPSDKALDIARQICAGLAAAHDRGVLHRDLKPANVMLDGRGRVRITDFGLAIATGAAGRDEEPAGTPLYMAPEQLAGGSASVRSDVYALGLVLYELYTGKRAFSAASFAELVSLKAQEIPRPPSELITDMDPAVDRLILRALARDPAARPASVAQVAAALPGGNPLEAALRAGETPSPEMVAASGTNEGLEPPIAWALMAIVVVGSMTAAALGAKGMVWRHAAFSKAPDVLADNARETLAALGHSARPADRASRFEVDLDYLHYLQRAGVLWRSTITEPAFLRFWYRESPQPLEAWRFPFLYGNVSRITPADPPLDIAGMALVRLDPNGRLTELVVVPPSTSGSHEPQRHRDVPDWTLLLTRAGVNAASLISTLPQRSPPVYADVRAAWEGTWPNRPDLPVRLEAASLHGVPVYFEAVFPWTPPARTPLPALTTTERGSILAAFITVGAMIVGAAIFARRNVRAGRGDRRGALRVSAFVFAAMVVSWFFGESHVQTMWEVTLVVMALASSLLAAAFCWLAYLAAEPFLRRRWPETLVGWARLVGGEVRDPLVGREVLIGCAAGPVLAVIAIASLLLPEWLGRPATVVFADFYGVVYGVKAVVPLLVWRAAQAVVAALASVFMLLLFRLALGSRAAAFTTFVLMTAVMTGWGAGAEHFWITSASTAIHMAVFVLLIERVGLLAAATQFYVWGLLIFFPVTSDLGAWYAGGGVTAMLVLAALIGYAFMTSLGGRPALGKAA